MTDLQLYLAIGLPCVTILTSLVISLVQISAVREDVLATREDTRAQIGSMREDIREIRSDIKLLAVKV